MANDYSITINAEDLEKFKLVLAQAPEKTMAEMRKAVNDSAIAVRNKARDYAPHDTGTLQNSIIAQPATSTPYNVSATVGTNLEYAPYQEYGTGMYGDDPHMITITPKNKQALFWPGALHPVKSVQNPGVHPKKYMEKAFTEGQEIFDKNVESALDRVISFLAHG